MVFSARTFQPRHGGERRLDECYDDFTFQGRFTEHNPEDLLQFKHGDPVQALLPSPLNPIQLAGGYFHLQPMVMMQQPGCSDRGTRVDVERSTASLAVPRAHEGGRAGPPGPPELPSGPFS